MSDHSFEIRRAIASDAPLIAKHRVSMFRDMRSVDASAEPMLLEAATQHIGEAMASGEYVGWLASLRGDPQRVVGGGGVQLRRFLPRPDDSGKRILIGREAIVLNVYVEPDFRRRGVARRLMEEILAWVPTTDIVQLVLHASEEGRPLYEGMGFVHSNEMRYAGAF